MTQIVKPIRMTQITETMNFEVSYYERLQVDFLIKQLNQRILTLESENASLIEQLLTAKAKEQQQNGPRKKTPKTGTSSSISRNSQKPQKNKI